MKIRICCPSYRRPKVKTLEYINNTSVYVAENEFEEYIKENKGFEKNIVKVSNEIQGNLCRIRNYIIKKEFENGAEVVLIVDDDLEGIYLWQGTKEMPYKKVKIEGKDIIDFIEKYSLICKEFGFEFWGLNCNNDALSYRQCSPFSTIGYIGGPFQCFLSDKILYDERLPLKEDYDMTLQQCNINRGVLRLNFAFYNCKQSEQKGGCATYRNFEKEKKQLELLQKKWGKEIVKIDKVKNSNQKREKAYIDYNPIIKVPIKGI